MRLSRLEEGMRKLAAHYRACLPFFYKCCTPLRESRTVNDAPTSISFSEPECHRLCALFAYVAAVSVHTRWNGEVGHNRLLSETLRNARVNLDNRGGTGESEICP